MEVVLQSSIVRSQGLVGYSQVAVSGGLGRPVIHLKARKTDLKAKYERRTGDYEEETATISCYILDCSVFHSLSPMNCSGVHTQKWIPQIVIIDVLFEDMNSLSYYLYYFYLFIIFILFILHILLMLLLLLAHTTLILS